MTINVLFVCLGNICRSPAAQGILEKMVFDAGLEQQIKVDSCGTAAFNVGKNPDPRSVAASAEAGYDISQQIARQIDDDDFTNNDIIIAMDRPNLTNIQAWAPKDFKGEINLFMHYAKHNGHTQIPDPYYADTNQFNAVINTLEKASQALLDYIKQHYLESSKQQSQNNTQQ